MTYIVLYALRVGIKEPWRKMKRLKKGKGTTFRIH